jgi:hypothetical protein
VNDDARVLHAAVVEGDEVRVVGEVDPALTVGMGELHRFRDDPDPKLVQAAEDALRILRARGGA